MRIKLLRASGNCFGKATKLSLKYPWGGKGLERIDWMKSAGEYSADFNIELHFCEVQ